MTLKMAPGANVPAMARVATGVRQSNMLHQHANDAEAANAEATSRIAKTLMQRLNARKR